MDDRWNRMLCLSSEVPQSLEFEEGKAYFSNFQLLSAAATLVSPKSKFNIRPFFLAFFPLFYRHLWSATVSRYFEISTGQISIKWNAKECWKLVEIDVRSLVSFQGKFNLDSEPKQTQFDFEFFLSDPRFFCFVPQPCCLSVSPRPSMICYRLLSALRISKRKRINKAHEIEPPLSAVLVSLSHGGVRSLLTDLRSD